LLPRFGKVCGDPGDRAIPNSHPRNVVVVDLLLAIPIGLMSAKEKLLERAPHWSEEPAERALRAAEGDVDDWGDLRAQTQELAEQAERRLRERERAAGETW
jgi:hypothetical protein